MKNFGLRGVLLAGAMMLPSTAWAQTESADPVDESAASAADDEIIVTARRANENLQDVPIAIFAADAEDLAKARIDSAGNLSQISPSIRVATASNLSAGVNILVRGIGTTGSQRAFEGAVGFFIDGVYRSRSGQALSDFLDIQNLQILRGPQGTLFGKNTSAGALLLTSNKPNTDQFGGTYDLALGNYGLRTVKGAINVPLGGAAALRVAGSFRDRDGFVSNPNNGLDYDSVRARAIKAQLLVEPSDNFSVLLIGDYNYQFGNCCAGTVLARTSPLPGEPASTTGNSRIAVIESIMRSHGITPPSRNFEDYEQVLNTRQNRTVRDRGVSLTLDLATGLGDLRSITAYRKFLSANPRLDSDFSGADIVNITDNFDTKFFSQEVTLSGKFGADGRSKYLVGAYFSDERIGVLRISENGLDTQAFFTAIAPTRGYVTPPGVFSITGFSAHNKSLSGFAQVDLGLTDTLTLTAGGRYSHERKQGSYFTIFDDGNRFNWPTIQGIGGLPFDDSISSNAFSGTASLQYRPNDDAMLYASYSRGFKSGGIVLDTSAVRVVGGRPTYNPEYVNTYEAGAKLDLFDRQVRANFAVFYNDITDLQVAQFSGTTYTVLNSPKATVYGAEFEGYWKISDALRLDLAATWLPEAKYGVDARLGGGLSGRRASQAPKLTFNAGLSLDKDVNESLAFTSRARVNYVSDNQISTSQNDIQKAHALLSLSAGFRSLDNGWTLEAFVDNLFDKRTKNNVTSRPLQTGVFMTYVGAPRTLGVTLRGSF